MRFSRSFSFGAPVLLVAVLGGCAPAEEDCLICQVDHAGKSVHFDYPCVDDMPCDIIYNAESQPKGFTCGNLEAHRYLVCEDGLENHEHIVGSCYYYVDGELSEECEYHTGDPTVCEESESCESLDE